MSLQVLFSMVISNIVWLQASVDDIKLINVTSVKSLNNFNAEATYVACYPPIYWLDPIETTNYYYWASSATVDGQLSPAETGEQYINVYDNNLQQYNGKDIISSKLPIKESIYHGMQFLQSKSCTSPSSNNIIQCYDYFKENDRNSYLQCQIFIISNASWSDPIEAVTFYNTFGEGAGMLADILCLNGSIFIGWINFDGGYGPIYYTLIDDKTGQLIIERQIIYEINRNTSNIEWASQIYFGFNYTSKQILALFHAQGSGINENKNLLYSFLIQYDEDKKECTLISDNITALYNDYQPIDFYMPPLYYNYDDFDIFVVAYQVHLNPAIINVINGDLLNISQYLFSVTNNFGVGYMLPFAFLDMSMLRGNNVIYFTWIEMLPDGSLMHIFSMDAEYVIKEVATPKLSAIVSANAHQAINGICAYILPENNNLFMEWVLEQNNPTQTTMLAQIFAFQI